jgi:hypothetical protein
MFRRFRHWHFYFVFEFLSDFEFPAPGFGFRAFCAMRCCSPRWSRRVIAPQRLLTGLPFQVATQLISRLVLEINNSSAFCTSFSVSFRSLVGMPSSVATSNNIALVIPGSTLGPTGWVTRSPPSTANRLLVEHSVTTPSSTNAASSAPTEAAWLLVRTLGRSAIDFTQHRFQRSSGTVTNVIPRLVPGGGTGSSPRA